MQQQNRNVAFILITLFSVNLSLLVMIPWPVWSQAEDDSANKTFLPLIVQGATEQQPSNTTPPPSDTNEGTTGLFIPLNEPNIVAATHQSALDDLTVKRVRPVTIRVDLLGGSEPTQAIRAANEGISQQVLLNFFDDAILVALLDQVVVNPSGSYSWIGHLADTQLSQVILTVREELMDGSIIFPGGIYRIQQVDGAIHTVSEIDQSAIPEDEVTLVNNTPEEDMQAAALSTTAVDDGSLIDVLVAYTDDARAGAGSRTAIELLIDTAVNETNTSYQNSGVSQRIRLVATAEVNYVETLNSVTDKTNLRNGAAGLQIVRDLRNAYAADVVIMITEQLQPDICGEAYQVMGTVGAAFRTDAYAVVKRTDNCISGNLSFSHELAHLMGARHDWYADATNNSPYTFNHGYVITPTLPNPVRTIMAYNDECDCQNESTPCPAPNARATPGLPWCQRLPFWSNPTLMHNAGTPITPNFVPLGVVAGTSTACTEKNNGNPECDAADFRALNSTASTVANFVSGNLATVRVNTQCTLTGTPPRCLENGSTTNPFDTLTEGVFRSAPNGVVTIQAGNYPETLVLVTKNPRELIIDRPMTLRATGGIVTIGQ